MHMFCCCIEKLCILCYNTMKAVICARYSSENQREESIEGQLRECYRHINIDRKNFSKSY